MSIHFVRKFMSASSERGNSGHPEYLFGRLLIVITLGFINSGQAWALNLDNVKAEAGRSALRQAAKFFPGDKAGNGNAAFTVNHLRLLSQDIQPPPITSFTSWRASVLPMNVEFDLACTTIWYGYGRFGYVAATQCRFSHP